MDPLDAAQLSNYVDWSTQVVEEAPAWFNLKTPFLTALDSFAEGDEVSLIGKRFYFDKEEAGGHTLPTKSSPDFNRAKQGQSDSMYARAMMYVLPTAIEYRFMQDIMRNKPGQRMKMERYLKGITEVGAQQQEFFALGDGRGALAFSASNLVVGTGLTMNCSTAAAADPGHTKGAVRLRKNQFYQAFNETTGNARGTLKVTTQGKTSCVVTVISGTVSSGDPICHVNGYNKAPRGTAQCLNNNPRILQGRDTSVDDVMNCPTLDKVNTRLTIPDRDTAKTILVTYNVDSGSRENLVWVTTPGLMSDLRQQQYGFGRKDMAEAATDSPKSYKDADGSTIIEAANMDEDMHIGFKRDQLKKLTEIEWGPLDDSGGPYRMLPGANETGSMLSARSWGCCWTIGIKSTRTGILIKRCTQPSVTQTVTGV
jgi:hypothetical protein